MIDKLKGWRGVSVGFALLAAVAMQAVSMATAIPAFANDDELLSMVRGGRLYDNWLKQTRQDAPPAAHVSYPKTGVFVGDPGANWLCHACHGWDYKGKDGAYGEGSDHFTGIKGINGMIGADPAKIATVLADSNHGFDKVLRKGSIVDLATFVSKGQIDMDAFIDRATGKAKGDPERHKPFFETVCATCHGREGLMIRTMQPLGDAARANPWKVMHNVLYGHPNEVMPALKPLDDQTLVDLVALMQTLPSQGELLSVVRGGRLYDDWIREARAQTPDIAQPAYPLEGRYAESPARNWRCKECHGWDYKGKDGHYGEGSSHYTGIKGIDGMAGGDPAKAIAILKDHNHGYDEFLEIRDLLDLANFVTKGQVKMAEYIDEESRKIKGDAKKYRGFYMAICANCHGTDGTEIATMRALGRSVKKNPWNAVHKVVNGHPDEKMPALRALPADVLKGIMAFAQTLPNERP